MYLFRLFLRLDCFQKGISWTLTLVFILGTTFSSLLFAETNQNVMQMKLIAKEYEKDLFNYWPELGVFWGRNNIVHDRFIDHSLKATKEWQKKEDHYLKALYQLDSNALKNSDVYITYQLLKETLENSKATRICKDYLWNINPSFDGWLSISVQIAENQPVGSEKNRDAALKRWRSFGVFVDVEIDNLKEGLKQGYIAPKAAVKTVLKQVQVLLNTSIEESPYDDFAKRDGNKAFQNQVADLIKEIINPALTRYAHFLKNDYLPYAREEIGVSALPNGTDCYIAKVKKETTINIKPQAIYDYGREHMRQLKKEVAVIGQKQFGKTSMSDIFQLAQSKPEFLFHSEIDILTYNLNALNRAKAKVGDWFGQVYIRDIKIKPYPAFRAATGASGEYYPPGEDGTRPGVFYINTYKPQTHSRSNQEAVLFHELIPGHHFQVSVASLRKNRQSLDQYFLLSGFGEGWALYVERLADEMGLYSDDISRIGMLSNEALRTARLVVDPGIHVMHWSREKAIAYLKKHTTYSRHIIEGEVDRYIMNPGQATAYMLGKKEIDALRKTAELRLKDKFSIKAFHDQILTNGMVPLPILQEHIQKWIKSNEG